MRTKKVLIWLVTGTLVILLARTIAYALQPGSPARLLEQQAGGPAFPALVLVTLALASGFAIVVCLLVALGVRERALLERRALAAPRPRIRPVRVLALALGLAIFTSFAGGLLEAYVHWRAGIGWHGLHCLFGPVHRNLIPIESALSLVAAVLHAAAGHVAAWMRRTFARVRAVPFRIVSFMRPVAPVASDLPRLSLRLAAGSPRAPPVFS